MRVFSPALLRYHVTQLRQSPATGVFLTCGWVAGVLLTFVTGQLVAANRAELTPLFTYLPWVMAILIPTLTMPAASEGRRGVTERLATLPHTSLQRLASRFAVLWALLGLWLLGFLPLVVTLAYLGAPDYGPIVTGILGSWLLAAPMLAISLVLCLRAKNGVGGLLSAMAATLLLAVLGTDTVTAWFAAVPGLGWLPSTAHLTLLGAYKPFTLGLLNLSAIFFLAGLTLFILGLSLRRRAIAVPVTGAVLLFLAMLPLLRWVQLDATAESLHTPSPQTIATLRALPSPVTFTLHVSQNNPDVPPVIHQAIESLTSRLLAIRAAAPSKINVRYSNTDRSIDASIAALQAGATEQSLPTGTTYFAALTVKISDTTMVMPTIDPARQPVQEYDLMSLVLKAKNVAEGGTQPRIAIIAANPEIPSAWQRQLSRNFLITPIPQSLGVSEIPSGTNVLILPDDAALTPETLASVRNYMISGGNIVLLTDTFSRTSQHTPAQPGEFRLSDLLPEFGLNLVSNSIIADPSQPTLAQQGGAGATAYPYWLSLTAKNLNAQLPFTAGVDKLFVPESGYLNLTPSETITLTPILSTSKSARAVSLEQFRRTPAELANTNLPDETGTYTLAAMASGPLGQGAARTGNLVVFADSDWLTTQSIAQSPANLTLFFNLLHYLSGQSTLTALQAKGTTPRTLTRIEDMANRLTQQTARTEQQISTRLYEVTNNPGDLTNAQEEEFRLRQQLRDIRQQTRHRLQTMENALLFLNLTFTPTVLGVLFFIQRRRQRLKATSTL